MQIVIVSDTHKKHEQLGVLAGDVLIHCGDFCDGFNVNDSDVDDLDDWFGRQQFELILCIGGNHDFAAPGPPGKRRRGFRERRVPGR